MCKKACKNGGVARLRFLFFKILNRGFFCPAPINVGLQILEIGNVLVLALKWASVSVFRDRCVFSVSCRRFSAVLVFQYFVGVSVVCWRFSGVSVFQRRVGVSASFRRLSAVSVLQRCARISALLWSSCVRWRRRCAACAAASAANKLQKPAGIRSWRSCRRSRPSGSRRSRRRPNLRLSNCRWRKSPSRRSWERASLVSSPRAMLDVKYQASHGGNCISSNRAETHHVAKYYRWRFWFVRFCQRDAR